MLNHSGFTSCSGPVVACTKNLQIRKANFKSLKRTIVKTIVFYFGIFLVLLFSFPAQSQEKKGIITPALVVNGDTIPFIELPVFVYYAPRIFANRREEAHFYRTVRNVKRVYPYAKLAGIKYREYNEMLVALDNDAQRRRAAKKAEDEIRAEFEGELRKLTFSQGRILIKLIDRETQNTSYDVLKDFRGNFTAVFWQSFGRLFGYNLKTSYDPEGEDKLIEEIIKLIEIGAI